MTAGTFAQRAAATAAEREAVRRLELSGPNLWGKYLFPHLLSGETSPLHDALNEWHRRETEASPGAMDAYAAPRGHGKSTGGVEVPTIYHAALGTRRFIVIASDTYTQAVDRLATVITEIENNADLRRLYPGMRPAIDDRGMVVRWQDHDIVLDNGVRIMAVGAGKSIRGARVGAQRPDLLMLDDLEDESSVATAEARAKRLRWILRVALGLADVREGLSALWVGTILSRSALLNDATGSSLEQGQERPEWARAWTPHVFAAELRGTPKRRTIVLDADGKPQRSAEGKPIAYMIGEPLWSELSRRDLAGIRYRVGATSYAAEYLSDPVDDGTTLLAPARVASYLNPESPPEQRIVVLPGNRIVPVSNMVRAAALDPQYATPGATTSPDLAAIVVAGQYGAETFILDSWVGRDRHGQASRLVDMAVRWGCYAAGVEAVAAQAVTADAAAIDGRVPIVPIKRGSLSKEERAMGLAVRLGDRERPDECRVYMLPDADRDTEYGQLSTFLGSFPHGRYDDPVDATVDAVMLAARGSFGTGGDTGSAPQTGGGRSQ